MIIRPILIVFLSDTLAIIRHNMSSTFFFWFTARLGPGHMSARFPIRRQASWCIAEADSALWLAFHAKNLGTSWTHMGWKKLSPNNNVRILTMPLEWSLFFSCPFLSPLFLLYQPRPSTQSPFHHGISSLPLLK